MEQYDHKKIENKWQKIWEDENTFATSDDLSKPKSYVLDMFPYPSGEGLHAGHVRVYTASDVYSRYKRLKGFRVLHPTGWDAFGLPAEQYALKHKVHPRNAVDANVNNFRRQMKLLGLSYDWEREIDTTDPKFYKWTQWIFLKLYEKGLAYESYEPINWCPSCQTGLANEDLDGNQCERCGTVVEKRPMRQWVLKITEYADRLIEDLSLLTKWPEAFKEAQKNWIGRSEGAEIDFGVEGTGEKIKIFTTRADTLFGATYVVLSPEHKLVSELRSNIKNWDEVVQYQEVTSRKTEIERTSEGKEKTGVKLDGILAVNPANGEKLPVFIADYVLAHYGTGAIMAVPAHDERDLDFAEKYHVDIKHVIDPGEVIDDKYYYSVFGHDEEVTGSSASYDYEKVRNGEKIYFAYTGSGKLINSGQFDGFSNEGAKTKITEFVGGKMKTTYKLRDWVFSRQRYWGEPIPIIHCEKCGVVPVPEKDLPVVLPDVKSYEPTGTGESPLAEISEWVNTKCPKCGGDGKRETNTMPQWAGSSWYYLRFIDPDNNEALIDARKEKEWMPVDLYVGGAEHATRHLIYARFWHKFLLDIGVVSTKEPFTWLEGVGLILAGGGVKMSKRLGNVVNPDEIIETYGADTLRLYEMFIGPFSQATSWDTKSIIGPRRFLERVWKLQEKISDVKENDRTEILINQTIKKVGEDIESFKFNTAISQMMILTSALESEEYISRESFESLVLLLAPFAPHFSEELWAILGNDNSISKSSWPSYEESKLVGGTAVVAVQVNGKLRDTLSFNVDVSEDDVAKEVMLSPRVKVWISDKKIKKTIYIKGRLFSIVTE